MKFVIWTRSVAHQFFERFVSLLLCISVVVERRVVVFGIRRLASSRLHILHDDIAIVDVDSWLRCLMSFFTILYAT